MNTRISDVIEQALRDPIFAEELKSKAMRAARAGTKSKEFDELLYHFATGPEDLARFGGKEGEGVGGTTLTTTTVTTTSTAGCTITTTTTTTTLTGNP